MPYLYQSKSICKTPSVTLTIPDKVNSNIIKVICHPPKLSTSSISNVFNCEGKYLKQLILGLLFYYLIIHHITIHAN